MNHLLPLAQNRPRPNQNIGLQLFGDRGRETADQAMQASFLNSSIKEEDFIDNEQPNIICSTSTDSISSQLNGNDMDQPDWDSNPIENSSSRPRTHTFSDRKNKHKTAEEFVSRRIVAKPKLSLSMYDISTIPTYPLTSKFTHLSTSTIQSQSMTTDASLPKSKDSGLPRSLSCFSLSSNSKKNYSHVQSKVKEYIKQIKEENGAKRKLSYKECSNATSCQTEPDFFNDESFSVKSLIPIIDQLKDELEDKDKMLYKLQENYDTLLTRYAAAENRIDHLRLNSGDAGNHAPFNFDKEDYRKQKASPNMLLLPDLENIQRESIKKHNSSKKNSYLKTPKQESSKRNCTVLSPITKPCSNSVRLDKFDLQPLGSFLPNEEDENLNLTKDSLHNWQYSQYQIDKNLSSRLTDTATLDRSDLASCEEHKAPSAVKELSPERLNHQVAENPFSKVKRWQESLPSFELIEPSSYENVLCINKSVSLRLTDSQMKEPVDQSFNDSSDTSFNKESNQACKLTNIFSHNMIYSRSISQPNNSLSDLASSPNNTNQLKSWPSQSSAQSSTSLEYDLDEHLIPTFNPDGLSLSVQVNTHLSNHATKQLQMPLLQKSQTCPSINQSITPVNRPRSLGLTESSHLRRRKLLGQKARLILSDYLKSSNSKTNISNQNKLSIFTFSNRSNHIFGLAEEGKNEFKGSYDDRDHSLVQCLEEMNQCAQNLKGKSEAIMQNVAKQLKDS